MKTYRVLEETPPFVRGQIVYGYGSVVLSGTGYPEGGIAKRKVSPRYRKNAHLTIRESFLEEVSGHYDSLCRPLAVGNTVIRYDTLEYCLEMRTIIGMTAQGVLLAEKEGGRPTFITTPWSLMIAKSV